MAQGDSAAGTARDGARSATAGLPTGVVWDERYAWHDSGRASRSPWAEPWPAMDTPESKRRLWNLLEVSGLARSLHRIPAREASREELHRLHDPDYVERIARMSADGGGEAGENARFAGDGFAVASLAAGGCLVALEAGLDGTVANAYALVRPCGHHAERDRGRGFRIFGNVAEDVRQLKC